MAIKNIIAKGIGFSPSTIKWIVTHGFGSAVANFPVEYALFVKAEDTTIYIPEKKNYIFVEREDKSV